MENVEFDNNSPLDRQAISLLTIAHAIVLVLIGTAILFGTGFMSWIVLIPALAAVSASATVLALLYARYRALPVTKAKRELAQEARRVERETRKQQERIRNANAKRESVQKQEQAAIVDRKREHEELLSNLSYERTSLADARQQDLLSELHKVQQEHLNDGLTLRQIQEARVRGLSSKLKKRLAQHGITKAADVEWARIKGIRGFNDKKIRRLLEWKNTIIKELNATQPNELPSSVEQDIERAYSAGLAKIDEREKSARRALEEDLTAIVREYEGKATQANATAAEAETSANRELADLGELESELSRMLQPYTAITFGKYLKRCIASAGPQGSPLSFVVLAGIPIVISFGVCFESFVGIGAAAAAIVNSIPTTTPTATQTSSPVPSRTPSPEPSPTSSSTETQAPPSLTPTSSPTPTPSPTPTATLEPRVVTQTAQAVQRQVTQAFEQNIRDIRNSCPAIEWVELSEAEYAKDYEGDCVYIKGRVSELNFEEELIEVWIGYYSARIPVGIGDLNNRPGRLTEDMWINIYGHICTSCWISTNLLDGSSTPIAGIDAILIEGPNALIWVRE